MHDLINSIKIEQPIAPQTLQASAVVGTAIDMQGAQSLSIIVAVGNIADTLDASNRLDVKIEHADDNGAGAPGSYSDCVDADVLNASGLASGVFLSVDAAGKENKRHAIGYIGGKRFVRVTATPVSLETGGPMAVLAIKGNLAAAPAANT